MNFNRSGFTLLELIIVIFLITLMIGLSSVFFANTLPSGRFSATAREIASTIRQTRHRAQLNGTDELITIDMDSRSYRIEGRPEKILPAGISLKVIDPVAGDITQGKYLMPFHPAGTTSGATIVLWNKTKTARVQTDPVAGAVIIK